MILTNLEKVLSESRKQLGIQTKKDKEMEQMKNDFLIESEDGVNFKLLIKDVVVLESSKDEFISSLRNLTEFLTEEAKKVEEFEG